MTTYNQGLKDGFDQAILLVQLYSRSVLDGFMEVQDVCDELVTTFANAQSLVGKGGVGKPVIQPAANGSSSQASAGSSPAATATPTLLDVRAALKNASIIPMKTLTSLKGKNVCFTGKLEYFTREQAHRAARKAGAYIQNSVSSYTQVLVVGKRSGQKVDLAVGNEVIIIDEKTFQNLI